MNYSTFNLKPRFFGSTGVPEEVVGNQFPSSLHYTNSRSIFSFSYIGVRWVTLKISIDDIILSQKSSNEDGKLHFFGETLFYSLYLRKNTFLGKGTFWVNLPLCPSITPRPTSSLLLWFTYFRHSPFQYFDLNQIKFIKKIYSFLFLYYLHLAVFGVEKYILVCIFNLLLKASSELGKAGATSISGFGVSINRFLVSISLRSVVVFPIVLTISSHCVTPTNL